MASWWPLGIAGLPSLRPIISCAVFKLFAYDTYGIKYLYIYHIQDGSGCYYCCEEMINGSYNQCTGSSWGLKVINSTLENRIVHLWYGVVNMWQHGEFLYIQKYFSKAFCLDRMLFHGPLTRYVKLQVAHAPGMPGTFPPAADLKENR